MTPRQLPPHPDLDQLRRQAKDLLQAARQHDAPARERFRLLPAHAEASADALARAPLALHDAQSVIAREHGFDSWNALRERVEELTLALDAAVEEFTLAATDGRRDRAERLLARFPTIPAASFHAALVLGDADRVDAALRHEPSLASSDGGPRGWAPIHYACHTSMAREAPGRAGGLVAIVRRLVALGVDPDTRFPWRHHEVYRPVLYGAARVVESVPLMRALLEAGAEPNDGVTHTLCAGAGDLPALEALLAHGADVNHPWATDGASPLYTLLAWSQVSGGAHWLVEHGADPNATSSGNGETPLHAVARGWDVPLAQALVHHGADVARARTDGRTPYAVAQLSGNLEVARWLLGQGASPALAPVDQLVAACGRGDPDAARGLLAESPELREQLTDEHYATFHLAAERGHLPALAAMLASGFDPNRADPGIGKTALHSAAMAGQFEAVRLLLAHGASVTACDREFQAPALIWAAEGARSQAGNGRDYAAVGRLLLDAGSPQEWGSGAGPEEGIHEILAEWRGAGAGSR